MAATKSKSTLPLERRFHVLRAQVKRALPAHRERVRLRKAQRARLQAQDPQGLAPRIQVTQADQDFHRLVAALDMLVQTSHTGYVDDPERVDDADRVGFVFQRGRNDKFTVRKIRPQTNIDVDYWHELAGPNGAFALDGEKEEA